MYKNKKVHLIGIGGISMSGIAEILLDNGAIITGSDIAKNKAITMLQEKGAHIIIGENKDLIKDADIVIYTQAINEANEELKEAKKLNKEIYERSVFLGLLTKNYKNVICISGTHGKSTTTGMISTCFINAKKNPTIQIGAYLPIINANYKIGSKDYFIMEACEYKDSFLHFFPTKEVILNIDDDHLDYFKNMEGVINSYNKYVNRLPQNGSLIINNDDENIKKLNLRSDLKILTYGINNDAMCTAKNIVKDDFNKYSFDIFYNNELFLNIKLNVLGIHNIYNALATTLICIDSGLDKKDIKAGIESYKGVERRFEFIGTYKENILLYDDYAHHPTEIKSTLDSAKNIKCHKNWAIFQSHTYSRTIEHLNDFANVLKDFDNIIIAPIYPARETNIWGVKETDLCDLIKPHNKNVYYIDSFKKIVDFLKNNLEENDLVITIGAGPINEVGIDLLKKD